MAVQELGVISIVTASPAASDLVPLPVEDRAMVPFNTIRRFANRSRRWIDAYNGGLDERQQASVEMQEGSHRRVMGEGVV